MTTPHRVAASSTSSSGIPAPSAPSAPQQLALLVPVHGQPATHAPARRAGRPAAAASAAAASHTLVVAGELPPQLRLDRRTRSIGRAGIAELRRILADATPTAA